MGEGVPVVTLLPSTVQHLEALESSREALSHSIPSPLPAGWPEFPESVGFTLERLREHPEESDWWMHFFLSGDDPAVLIGSGGYVGPPVAGVVEIGYEIAPAFRATGYGIAAAKAMIVKAARTGTVNFVIANTLAHANPSTGVLRRLGFGWEGEFPDPDEGALWRWKLALEAGR